MNRTVALFVLLLFVITFLCNCGPSEKEVNALRKDAYAAINGALENWNGNNLAKFYLYEARAKRTTEFTAFELMVTDYEHAELGYRNAAKYASNYSESAKNIKAIQLAKELRDEADKFSKIADDIAEEQRVYFNSQEFKSMKEKVFRTIDTKGNECISYHREGNSQGCNICSLASQLCRSFGKNYGTKYSEMLQKILSADSERDKLCQDISNANVAMCNSSSPCGGKAYINAGPGGSICLD